MAAVNSGTVVKTPSLDADTLNTSLHLGQHRCDRSDIKSAIASPINQTSTHAALNRRTNSIKSMPRDRKSTRLNQSLMRISYAVFCLKKKKLTIKKPRLNQTITIPK